MALEALSSNDLFNFIIYDTISAAATPFGCNNESPEASALLDRSVYNNGPKSDEVGGGGGSLDSGSSVPVPPHQCHSLVPPETNNRRPQNLAVQGRKKRRRRPRVCKNKEEAETQRMTHIAVERNRRKQMNEHLAVLRSLMPESYVQRGDQASIVGGAIEFVKELEHLLQSLEAQKFKLLDQHQSGREESANQNNFIQTPFSQFFAYPQYTAAASSSHSQSPNIKYTSKSKGAVADIEVTLIETHANVRILISQRRLRQLSRLVVGFQTMYLSILHLNVTTLDPLVLYSISAKVEEGCQLSSADEIAGAVNHLLRIMEDEDEANLCCQS